MSWSAALRDDIALESSAHQLRSDGLALRIVVLMERFLTHVLGHRGVLGLVGSATSPVRSRSR